MHVISKKPLREFATKHADARTPLGAWLKLVEHGTFRNLAELKKTFSGVDMVPVKGNEFYVFNIGGKMKTRTVTRTLKPPVAVAPFVAIRTAQEYEKAVKYLNALVDEVGDRPKDPRYRSIE